MTEERRAKMGEEIDRRIARVAEAESAMKKVMMVVVVMMM